MYNANLKSGWMVLSSFVEHLSETQIRDDYKELLQLTLIYLGNVPPSGIEFHKPGSFYLSR